MAEFALGLTKTAVEGTLSLVKSAVEEEKKLRDKVQNDLVFITAEFEVMQSFLHNANREHAANDSVALTLVRQLRTLAFDVEDCVEYVIHLDLDKSSILGGLRRLWQTVNCRAPPLPLDIAVAEIKQLKARVEDVSQRNTRYNNLILHGSTNNNRQQPAVTVVMTPAEQAPSSAPAFHILRNAWEATGKWSSNKCNLQQDLLIAREGEGDHDLRVISIWESSGTGGGGGAAAAAAGPRTATILTKAYCDPEICENFKIRGWVKLAYPFNHDEFVKSLLAQFYASTSHQGNNAGVDFCAWWMTAEVTKADNLMKANNLLQQMREQRYLVVLEDVMTVAEWDVIRMYLPDSKNGSRILLSTPQLDIALLCTGEPYQVSELRNFSGGNQFLCAFSRKVETPSVLGKFYRQLLRGHGVISVWGADDDDKSNLIDVLYEGIINGWLENVEGIADKSNHVDILYNGIRSRTGKFELRHSSWVDVPDPFNLKVFAQRLFLNFHSDNIQASEITKVGMKGGAGLMQWCREFLSKGMGHPYVVVLYGLRSKDDWNLIQSYFFSSKATTAEGCILVTTDEETVATYCVKDHTYLSFNAKELKADPSISTLINKGCWHYAIRGKKGRLFYDRRKDAREWTNRFGKVGGNNLDPDEGKGDEEGFHVFMVTGNGDFEKGVLRHAYYGALFQQQFEHRSSWVDLPLVGKLNLTDSSDKNLNLMDFAWHLLLDFYSDDPRAKETIAVDLMNGTINPIEKCREFLRNEKWLVVINGLRSIEHWNSIKDTLFSEQHNQSIIIIGSAMLIWQEDDFYRTTKALRLGTQEQGLLIDMEYHRIFSTHKRYEEAMQWIKTRQPVGRDSEVEWLGSCITTELLLHRHNLFSIWGIPGVGKSTIVRTVYYNRILHPSGLGPPYTRLDPYEAFAWVEVPSPFNLIEFAWRLFLDFYSDNPQAKEAATISMVEEGHRVPILECCKILRNGKCLVVIDGLCSKQDWDLIKATFLAEPIRGTIVVITNEEEVAIHCVENDKKQAINITRLEANATKLALIQ